MVELFNLFEELPTSYPDAPAGLSEAAAALDADMIWQRIESYVAHRWTPRTATWMLVGDGNWLPNLTPVTISTFEYWDGGNDAYVSVSPRPGAFGGFLLEGRVGTEWKITGSVGGGATVPATVNEAFRRLAEYLADDRGDPSGASDFSMNIGGEISESHRRSAQWVARAMQLSGAADLLRPFRKV
jgi:hypothetical protein